MLSRILNGLDITFTALYTVELLLKVLAHGLIVGKHSYLRDPWNMMDLCVVITSILNLADIGPGNALRVLRLFRILRALRMIRRFPQLKIVVDALLLSLPSVANVALLCALFFLVFSLLGVGLLKGTFMRCSGEAFDALTASQKQYLTNPSMSWDDIANTAVPSTSDERCLLLVDTWVNSSTNSSTLVPTSKQICDCWAPGSWQPVVPQNFDNVLNGMALLFEISTTEGWLDVMHAASDQRGLDSQPLRDHNLLWALFFISFLLVGAFFVMEIFVAVTVATFNRLRDANGTGLMTQAQREWALTQAFVMRNVKPERRTKRPSHNTSRAKGYDFIMPSTNRCFEDGITCCILLNFVVVACTSFGESRQKATVLECFNLLFTIIFLLEAGLKIFVLRSHYFRRKGNIFDLSIVLGSVIGLLVNALNPSSSPVITLIQACRALRLVRLVRSVKSLRVLFNTMVSSIPSIANIGALLGLIFFIYAIVGRQLYSFLPDTDGGVGHTANFRSFRNAILLLLRFSTGEAWNGFMHSIHGTSDSGCDPDPTFNPDAPWCLTTEDLPNCTVLNGCPGGTFATYAYFYSFTLLVSYVVLNLFVAVVLEAFDNSKESDILSADDLESFTRLWAEYDEDATWYIEAAKVKELISRLGPPLGFGFGANEDVHDARDIESLMQESGLADIPVNRDGKCNIVPVATLLGKSKSSQVEPVFERTHCQTF